MTAPVGPVQPVNPAVRPAVVTQPGVTLDPSVMGGPYNPVHGQFEWDDPTPYAIQQGLDLSGQGPTVTGSLLGTVPDTPVAGADPDSYADPTATMSHAAPWPHEHIADSGAVNNNVVTAQQELANARLHGYDDGTAAAFTTNLQAPTGHKMPWDLSPDFNSQGLDAGTDVGQLDANNNTGRDRFQGMTAPGDNINRFGFDQAHVHRQNPAGEVPVPLNTTQGKQRPMVMNIPGRYEYPTGPGSPFAGQLAGVGNNVGAAEIGTPSDYQPPPFPPSNPALAQQQTASVMTGTEDIWLWRTPSRTRPPAPSTSAARRSRSPRRCSSAGPASSSSSWPSRASGLPGRRQRARPRRPW
jgi:hypothetical protein